MDKFIFKTNVGRKYVFVDDSPKEEDEDAEDFLDLRPIDGFSKKVRRLLYSSMKQCSKSID
jgi:hypothetical protein